MKIAPEVIAVIGIVLLVLYFVGCPDLHDMLLHHVFKAPVPHCGLVICK